MALIQCPECNKEISDKATVCPGCGMPMTPAAGSAPASTAAEEMKCPEFPSDLSVGELAKKVRENGIKVHYDQGENTLLPPDQKKLIPPTGNVKVGLCQNGIRIYALMFGLCIIDIHSSQLISIHDVTQQDLEQTDKSVIGRAVVGGLILGPLGAIIGGMSGMNKVKVKSNHVLIINYWNVQTKKAETILFRGEQPVGPFVSSAKTYARENGWSIK